MLLFLLALFVVAVDACDARFTDRAATVLAVSFLALAVIATLSLSGALLIWVWA